MVSAVGARQRTGCTSKQTTDWAEGGCARLCSPRTTEVAPPALHAPMFMDTALVVTYSKPVITSLKTPPPLSSRSLIGRMRTPGSTPATPRPSLRAPMVPAQCVPGRGGKRGARMQLPGCHERPGATLDNRAWRAQRPQAPLSHQGMHPHWRRDPRRASRRCAPCPLPSVVLVPCSP